MAKHRHKRETNARLPKAVQVAGSIAVMATVSAVSLGVYTAPLPNESFLASGSERAPSATSEAIVGGSEQVVERAAVVSRSKSRLQERKQAARRELRKERDATQRAVRRADTRLWTTTELNLWSGPERDADKVGLIDGLEKVLVTGRKDNGRVEIVLGKRARWVTAGYLADEKPSTEPRLGGSCANGTSVSGSANVIGVHNAVCAAFPDITSYGTYRGDGEHAQGIAIDIMVSGERGWEVAEFLRTNYSALGISYLIYAQKIWSVERGGEGWRSMSDRGSATANHYDHVHVTTY